MTPTTTAGRARMRVVSEWASGYPELVAREEDQVLAIEAQAVAAERARLAAAVRWLRRDRGDDSWDTVDRTAVLALLTEPK